MTMPTRTVFDHQGQPVPLGPELASGGEGIVYPLLDQPAVLAKIYRATPESNRIEKLRWMVREQSSQLCRLAAWPTATLHDSPGGPMAGFLMPRFDGYRPIHTLYSPAHRRASFPQADWSFLIHSAMNCASAFDAIHAANIVIGDVNQSNVLVSKQALVSLIDCDSFQVRAGDRLLRCEVGVSQYTPSELQGRSFHEVVRTVNHDRFGLAVLMFHLLFMGRHPFAGRFLGSGEMPLERAIEEYRFVYSRQAADHQMGPPPFALALTAVSAELAELFERAFARGAERKESRPTAAQWHVALSAFQGQLQTCGSQAGHKMASQATDCPWCGIIRAGGPNFFLGTGPGGGTYRVDRQILAEIWKRIEGVPAPAFNLSSPPAAPAPASLQARPKPRSHGLSRRLRPILEKLGWWGFFLVLFSFWMLYCLNYLNQTMAWILGLLCYPALWFVVALGEAALDFEKKQRKEALDMANHNHLTLLREAVRLTQHHSTEFPRIKKQLRQLRDRFENLQTEFEAECPRKNVGFDPVREARQREQYLREQFLSDPDQKVAGIGPGRLVMLASYGVETAYDVTEEALAGVRGIGPKLRDNLLAWKDRVLARFVYDPHELATDEAPPTLVLKYRQVEESLRGQMQKGLIDLEALNRQTEEQLESMREQLERVSREKAQAECDWRAVN
jgi:DNA-binding helix-hairpin-helix protein with protein kinase domain